MEKFVQVERVGQTFDTKKGKFVALRDIDLTIKQGEFIALIGHSGCGKSTLLNLIAGLTKPTSGVLLLEDREIAGPGPERAVVFQNHSLLPWLTCFENVYLAVERVFGEKEGKAKLKERTAAAINLVGLDHASAKYPNEISGGMKQRVGIGFWVWDEWNNLKVEHIIIAIFVIGIVGLLLEQLLLLLAKRLHTEV